MLGLSLVCPLEDDWRDAIDAVAAARGWPTTRDVATLGKCVSALSAAYNDPARARASAREAGAARLGFSFARDVPKGAGAVRELVATGTLRLNGGTLRVLDLGAGFGATTWGVVRALEASGASGTVEATWVDADAVALDVASAVVKERALRQARLRLLVRTVARSALRSLDDLGEFDLVLAGQLLSELGVGTEGDVRLAMLVERVSSWLARNTRSSGTLVVVEPALRDRTRTLHRVRDALASRPEVTIFAPCLHAIGCPALARESDWCHEDLDVDLPAWLTPVAHAAGLRREGLTFSYLVLRKDGVRLGDRLELQGFAPLRVVSRTIRSKGKLEALLCGGPVRCKAMRLDREAEPGNAAWDTILRGEVIGAELEADPKRPGADLMRLRGRVRLLDAIAPPEESAETR
jgi:hypothetical protein